MSKLQKIRLCKIKRKQKGKNNHRIGENLDQ